MTNESFVPALIGLVAKARHRYGGYIVHLGVGLMFFGFCGRAWEHEGAGVITVRSSGTPSPFRSVQ